MDDYEYLRALVIRQDTTFAKLLHEIIKVYKGEKSSEVGDDAGSPLPPAKEADI